MKAKIDFMSRITLSPATNSFFLVGAVMLTTVTTALAFIVWGRSNQWQLLQLSWYQLFPLLGLLAFSIMWSQYMVEAAQNLTHRPDAVTRYFKITSWLVLLAIVLHPGLLIVQRYKDGYGLPPHSYETYVAPMKAWLTILGSASLLMFLAFEFKRFFGKYSWWKFVLILNDIAIVAIFYHGLRLGTQLQQGWFQYVWYFYGITLLAALSYKYYLKLRQHLRTNPA